MKKYQLVFAVLMLMLAMNTRALEPECDELLTQMNDLSLKVSSDSAKYLGHVGEVFVGQHKGPISVFFKDLAYQNKNTITQDDVVSLPVGTKITFWKLSLVSRDWLDTGSCSCEHLLNGDSASEEKWDCILSDQF